MHLTNKPLGNNELSAQHEIITSKNLVAGYPDNIVWRDATFSIDRGEFVAVIGPNGAGKTTLFRLLLGLQQPVSGAIKIFDAAPNVAIHRLVTCLSVTYSTMTQMLNP